MKILKIVLALFLISMMPVASAASLDDDSTVFMTVKQGSLFKLPLPSIPQNNSTNDTAQYKWYLSYDFKYFNAYDELIYRNSYVIEALKPGEKTIIATLVKSGYFTDEVVNTIEYRVKITK